MWDSPSHWAIVALLAIALFGYKKLPDASRAVGRSLRIFKTELKGMSEDDQQRESAQSAQATPAAQPVIESAPPAVPAEQVPPAGAGGSPTPGQP